MITTWNKIYELYGDKDRDMLLKAYNYAKEAHSNQKRASGEPYFIHPCAVALILMELGLDAPTVAAALLHDVIEDTPATEEDIKREFGDEVLELVSGVTKLDKIVFKSQEQEEAENFRKIFVAMAKDIRVIIIKMADRLHNMRSLNFLSPERQQKMARETLDIFAPLAGRLGISQIKCELEDLCLNYLDPEAYEYLVVNINEKLSERREFVNSIVKEIKDMMEADGIRGEVFGRPKHFYSIYKKMKNKGKSLDQIYDLTALRVIVGDVKECYTILGEIHEKWKPLPGRIKDYIANPKPNKYQSLHTTVMTRFGQPFEIQIRTEEMHRIAEFGIAAHWKYKEGRTEEENSDFENKLTWLREVMAGRRQGLPRVSRRTQNRVIQRRAFGVYAAGQGHFPAARSHARRFRLCDTLGGGQPLHGGARQFQNRAVDDDAGSGGRGGDHHLAQLERTLARLAEVY